MTEYSGEQFEFGNAVRLPLSKLNTEVMADTFTKAGFIVKKFLDYKDATALKKRLENELNQDASFLVKQQLKGLYYFYYTGHGLLKDDHPTFYTVTGKHPNEIFVTNNTR